MMDSMHFDHLFLQLFKSLQKTWLSSSCTESFILILFDLQSSQSTSHFSSLYSLIYINLLLQLLLPSPPTIVFSNYRSMYQTFFSLISLLYLLKSLEVLDILTNCSMLLSGVFFCSIYDTFHKIPKENGLVYFNPRVKHIRCW